MDALRRGRGAPRRGLGADRLRRLAGRRRAHVAAPRHGLPRLHALRGLGGQGPAEPGSARTPSSSTTPSSTPSRPSPSRRRRAPAPAARNWVEPDPVPFERLRRWRRSPRMAWPAGASSKDGREAPDRLRPRWPTVRPPSRPTSWPATPILENDDEWLAIIGGVSRASGGAAVTSSDTGPAHPRRRRRGHRRHHARR